MKKIIIKIQQISCIIFDTFINFLFCVRLLHELKYEPFDEHKIKNIKVLLQFLAKSFDDSAFEYYNLNNEDYLWPIYETIKKKNSKIFQLIVLLHSFLFNHFIYQIVYTIFGYSCYIDKYFAKLNKKLDKQIQNNFGYEYLRDYKEYYKNNPKYYNKIKYMIFIKETLFNIYRYFWSKKKNKNIDDLWEKQFNLIGKYFNKNKKNKPINLNNWFESNLENYF